MIELFSLEGIQKKPAVFDITKLDWTNGQYLSMLSAEELLPPVTRELDKRGISAGNRDLRPVIDVVKIRSRTILDIADQVATRLTTDFGPGETSLKAGRAAVPGWASGHDRGPRGASPQRLEPGDHAAPPSSKWRSSTARNWVMLTQPIRIALTGSTVSEPVNELLVGRETRPSEDPELSRESG